MTNKVTIKVTKEELAELRAKADAFDLFSNNDHVEIYNSGYETVLRTDGLTIEGKDLMECVTKARGK